MSERVNDVADGMWIGAVKVGCPSGVGNVSSSVERVISTGEWSKEQ